MTLLLDPVPRESIASRIHAAIRAELMTGALRPGEAITLRSVAERLGTSQTPVREALLQMVSEGVLALRPGRPVAVPVLDRAALEELREIRVALETLAARRATPHVTRAIRAELAGIHATLAKARRRADREGVMKANLGFHFTLYAAAGRPQLLRAIENLWLRSSAYLSFLYQPPFPELPGEHPHLAILRALEEGDAKTVAKQVRRDIEDYGALLMARLAAQGLV